MEMGEKINSLRVQKGMTLEELGNKVGVGKSTVRKWENGMIANMRRDKIAKIADALDCSPAYLMGWDEPKNDFIFSLSDGSKIIIENMETSRRKETQRLLSYFFSLDNIGQKKALDNIEDLAKIYSEKTINHYTFSDGKEACTIMPFTDVYDARNFLKSRKHFAAWKVDELTDKDILTIANGILSNGD